MRTALRAVGHVMREDEGAPRDCEAGFRWIAADVFANSLVVLLGYAEEYATVRRYIENQSDAITQTILHVIRPQEFDNYRPEQREEKRAAYIEARNAWLSRAHVA